MPETRNLRKAPRAYSLKPTQIQLKSSAYRMNDISSTGMGLVMTAGSPEFVIGERLDNIPIPLQSGTVAVKGVVTHLSVTDNGTVCGIQFEFSGDEFDAIIQFKKERTRVSPA